MIVEQVNIEQLKEYVELVYRGDDDLLNTYHIDPPYTFEEGVEETMQAIKNVSEQTPTEHYGVLKDGEKIGYFVAFENNLYSFGIAIGERTRGILREFWGKIVEIVGNEFICVLYKNNTRAINWLEKCGMGKSDIETDDNSIVLVKI